jgi:hypothetical protein
MKKRSKIPDFLLEHIPGHPNDIIPLTQKELNVSKVSIHRHLRILLEKGLIIKSGFTTQVGYYLKKESGELFTIFFDSGLDEHDVWMKYFEENMKTLNKNVYDIISYGFTEIFNNAIDHSEGSKARVEIEWGENVLTISVIDDGVGIFEKIKNAFNLIDERESILQLAKGKLTTDPDNHSGEGIFFASRAFDEFFIVSNELSYSRYNSEDDFFVERKGYAVKGTSVMMDIKLDSKKSLLDIFKEYSVESEDGIPGFNKTRIAVQLAQLDQERYVSRSQAKRLLVNLDKFEHIILDFKKVEVVGQAFVDEVFRVFKNKNPKIKIDYKNTNDDIEFMIKRGIPQT